MELPANIMTPTVSHSSEIYPPPLSNTLQAFTERVKHEFSGIPNVEIIVRDEGTLNQWTSHSYLTTFFNSMGSREGNGETWSNSNMGADNLDLISTKQRTFLSVTKGTSEPAKFLEMWVTRILHASHWKNLLEISHYKGAAKDAQPLVLVGKGITFDSGGISIKPSAVSFSQ